MKNQLVLKELSTAEVQERLDVERALLQKMKINHAISPIENPNKIKESRKIIFRKLNSSTTLKNDNNVYNCVYRWINENNEIVYIGKTKDLVQRTRMHLVARNDELHKKWLTNNLRIEYVSFKEYGDCSVAEPYFIMKHKPIGNSDFMANDISISIPQFDELEWKEFDFEYIIN